MKKLPRFVQVKNPRSGLWVKLDRERGKIVGHSPTKWLGVPVAKPKRK